MGLISGMLTGGLSGGGWSWSGAGKGLQEAAMNPYQKQKSTWGSLIHPDQDPKEVATAAQLGQVDTKPVYSQQTPEPSMGPLGEGAIPLLPDAPVDSSVHFTAEATARADAENPWAARIRGMAERPRPSQAFPAPPQVPPPAAPQALGTTPFQMNPVTGEPDMGAMGVAAGIGRRTPRSRMSIAGTRGYDGQGRMNRESPYSEAIRGGGF